MYKMSEIIKEENQISELLKKFTNETQSYIKYTKIKNMIQDILDKKGEIEEIKYYDIIIESIESNLTSENFGQSNLDNDQEEVIEIDKMKITLTTTKCEKLNINKNVSSINLDLCETLLKNNYNIPKNNSLYIKKTEISQKGIKIPKIEYDLYYKLSDKKLHKLNISICKNSTIFLLVPTVIEENLDILNISSDYYNNICYTTTSERGTDISLKDRKNEYIHKVVCQDECVFTNYNYNIKKANCSCKVKESSKFFLDIIINKTKLYQNFLDTNYISNINILVCYKKLFNKNDIFYIIGFYIITAIIIFHIICTFIFYFKEIDLITKKIKEIIFGIMNINLIKTEEKEKKRKNNTIVIKDKIMRNVNNKSLTFKKGNVKKSYFMNDNNKNNIKENKNINKNKDNKSILASNKIIKFWEKKNKKKKNINKEECNCINIDSNINKYISSSMANSKNKIGSIS